MALNCLFCADMLYGRPLDLVPLTDFTNIYQPANTTNMDSKNYTGKSNMISDR